MRFDIKRKAVRVCVHYFAPWPVVFWLAVENVIHQDLIDVKVVENQLAFVNLDSDHVV